MNSDQNLSYLDPHVLATLGSLEVRARLMMEGIMTGMHQSPYRGASVEFAQHRPYVPGDDLRHLDWKVFGRTDKLYLKQHQRETNLDLVVLADASGSMAYSSLAQCTRPWRKYDHAACLAAAMALLALRQQDRVGLLVFAEDVVGSTPASSADDQWRTVVQVLESHQPTGGAEDARDADPSGNTSLQRLFERATAMATRRSLLVLISDLFDSPESLERGLALIRHLGHDLMILQTLDPAETDFNFRSPTKFIGLEHEGRITVDPAAIRQAYLEAIGRHLDQVAELTRRFHFDYQRVDTGQAMGPTLSHFLAQRATAIRRRL